VGRIPRRYRGRDLIDWMLALGLGEQRPEDLEDPAEVMARQAQISGTKGGHSVSCHSLARAGATLTGRLERVEGRTLHLRDDLLVNVARGDAQSAKIRAGVDHFIKASGIDAPVAEPDEADEPFEGLHAMAQRRSLDLDETNVRSVIFCTGFTGRFEFLDPRLLDASGRPRHDKGACEAPGLYCVGLMWLRRRFSGIIAGVDADARHVAGLIAARSAVSPQ
jgi:putative flavoprotein involved in K+ transport